RIRLAVRRRRSAGQGPSRPQLPAPRCQASIEPGVERVEATWNRDLRSLEVPNRSRDIVRRQVAGAVVLVDREDSRMIGLGSVQLLKIIRVLGDQDHAMIMRVGKMLGVWAAEQPGFNGRRDVVRGWL